MQFQTTYFRKNSQKRKIQITYCLLLATCCILAFSSCEDSFDPLKENNQYNFNISGYLDASADTQWVRVGTIRESIDEPPDPTGIRVTLEDLQSGETVVMNDSVFTTRNVLNYWTTMDIENEKTYRIIAEGTSGRESSVTATTPKEQPPVYIIKNLTPLEYHIYIDDAFEYIADLQSVWHVIINPGSDDQRRIYRFPLRRTLSHTYAFFGSYTTTVIYQEELNQIRQTVGNAELLVKSRQFFIASAGPDWNDNLTSINDLEYFLDGTGSNVENGLGFVAGVDARWFKQEACLTADSSNYIPCEPEKPFW